MSRHRLAGAAAAMFVFAAGAFADEETKTVIAGRPDYKRSAYYKWHFGEGYREVWTEPFQEKVLDLRGFAGGLTAVRQVGSMQSLGLALKGADGKAYTFRLFDKDPTKILPAEWRDSFPATIFQDQTTASHPGAALVVPPLAEAAQIPHTSPIAVYMPDDPALGEHRAVFGGKPGLIDEYPLPASPGYAGYQGATEIISTTKLWERWLAGDTDVDAQALLRCRLFDLFIGDWDRHDGQWRWMRLPGRSGYVALPEDRDQAFSSYTGVMLGLARTAVPRLVAWHDDYRSMKGLLFQGREVDDWLLLGVERPAFEATARELQAALTDSVIEAAVHRMPGEWFKHGGEKLIQDLKKRRDLLLSAADAFYENLSLYPNIKGTDQADVVHLTREAGGNVLLEMSSAGTTEAPGRTYLKRRFLKNETREIRLYLYGGDDRFVSEGPRGGITVRVSGSRGKDVLDDSASGGTRFYDVDSKSEVKKGPGTSFTLRPWTDIPRKAGTPWTPKQDWGSFTTASPLLWWEPDPGIVLSAIATKYRFGYHKEPYASMHTAAIEYKTKRNAFKVSYFGDFRWAAPGFGTSVTAALDGASNYNYYGVGNETAGEENDFTEADQQIVEAWMSAVGYENHRRTYRIALGPEVKFGKSRAADDTLIAQTKPYGFGDFTMAGARLRFESDTRGRSLAGLGLFGLAPGATISETGLKVSLDAAVYPKALDVTKTFGTTSGQLTGYWQAGKEVILAGRVGGQKVWGEYPWFQAAFIGGSDTVRGYGRNRYAGDASLYANAEAIVGLFNLNLIFPMRVGVIGLTDVGRVFLAGEDSQKWHPSYGGGIFVRVLTTRMALHGLLVSGQGAHFYVNIGYGL